MVPGYTPSTVKTASPSNSGAGTTITQANGTRAWIITVAAQTAYLTTDASAPTSTNGLTLPVGGPYFLPFGGNLTVLAGTSGAIVNAIPLT